MTKMIIIMKKRDIHIVWLHWPMYIPINPWDLSPKTSKETTTSKSYYLYPKSLFTKFNPNNCQSNQYPKTINPKLQNQLFQPLIKFSNKLTWSHIKINTIIFIVLQQHPYPNSTDIKTPSAIRRDPTFRNPFSTSTSSIETGWKIRPQPNSSQLQPRRPIHYRRQPFPIPINS